MTTDHVPRAKLASRISHAFALWNSLKAFCGLEFKAGETVETDRVTCPTCLKELETVRKT